jgi:hypothetical protein
MPVSAVCGAVVCGMVASVSAFLAASTSGTACARAPVAVRVVSAAPAISDAVMRCVMVVSFSV